MIFEDSKYNCSKYEFHYKYDASLSYSYRDVCQCLTRLTELIYESSTPILLHCKTLSNESLYVSNVEEKVLNRTYADIENLIVRKKEFRNKLSILHIDEPEDKNSPDFVYYLQLVYFFYIMTYFVFPKVKFFDLFKEKNWSSENTMEADTGNEVYEYFILQNLYEDPLLKNRHLNKVAAYDEEWGHCNDRFFDYYVNFVNLYT